MEAGTQVEAGVVGLSAGNVQGEIVPPVRAGEPPLRPTLTIQEQVRTILAAPVPGQSRF